MVVRDKEIKYTIEYKKGECKYINWLLVFWSFQERQHLTVTLTMCLIS